MAENRGHDAVPERTTPAKVVVEQEARVRQRQGTLLRSTMASIADIVVRGWNRCDSGFGGNVSKVLT